MLVEAFILMAWRERLSEKAVMGMDAVAPTAAARCTCDSTAQQQQWQGQGRRPCCSIDDKTATPCRAQPMLPMLPMLTIRPWYADAMAEDVFCLDAASWRLRCASCIMVTTAVACSLSRFSWRAASADRLGATLSLLRWMAQRFSISTASATRPACRTGSVPTKTPCCQTGKATSAVMTAATAQHVGHLAFPPPLQNETHLA